MLTAPSGPLPAISASAQPLFPPPHTRGVFRSVVLAPARYLDPSQLCYALAKMARAGCARILERTRVPGIDVLDGRVRSVRTDRGDIACEVVVNCGGMFGAEIGRLAGVRIPLVPMSHQYLITESFLPRTGKPLPTLRDPDVLVYFRQEVEGPVMGGYERDPEPGTASGEDCGPSPAGFTRKPPPGNRAARA